MLSIQVPVPRIRIVNLLRRIAFLFLSPMLRDRIEHEVAERLRIWETPGESQVELEKARAAGFFCGFTLPDNSWEFDGEKWKRPAGWCDEAGLLMDVSNELISARATISRLMDEADSLRNQLDANLAPAAWPSGLSRPIEDSAIVHISHEEMNRVFTIRIDVEQKVFYWADGDPEQVAEVCMQRLRQYISRMHVARDPTVQKLFKIGHYCNDQ